MSFHDTGFLWTVIGLSAIALVIVVIVIMLFLHRKEPKHTNDDINMDTLKEQLASLTNKSDKEIKLKEIKLTKKQEETIIKEKTQSFEVELQNKFNDRPYQELKPFDYFTKKRGTWRKIKENWLNKNKPQNILLVNMELNNNFHTMFLAFIKEGIFKYKQGTYVIDETKHYYISDLKIYAADYHESFALPIIRKLPVADIKKTA